MDVAPRGDGGSERMWGVAPRGDGGSERMWGVAPVEPASPEGVRESAPPFLSSSLSPSPQAGWDHAWAGESCEGFYIGQ